MVADYNTCKYTLGVDKLNQLVAYDSFLHKSVKRWHKVFWLLEAVVINANLQGLGIKKRREAAESPGFPAQADYML